MEAWEELRDCRICPRNCGVDRLSGETGFCGAGEKLRLARAALHHWEEPCISGDRGSGTVFFSFCNLRCVFCQNHEISQAGSGLEISAERLGEIFLELQAQGAHNINLVTPTHYIPQIRSALLGAKEKGLELPIVYNSSGYESVEALKQLSGLIDIYMPDVKFFDSKSAGKLAGCSDYFTVAMSALTEMFRQTGEPVLDGDGLMKKGMLVRHLLLPGQRIEAKKIIEAVFEVYQNRIYYSLMNQYTPVSRKEFLESALGKGKMFEVLQNPVLAEDYEEWIDFAVELGLENGFIQEGETAQESFIPAFDFQGVIKSGHIKSR